MEKTKGIKTVLLSVALVAALQVLRELAYRLIAPDFPVTEFASRMITMCIMAVLAAVIILVAIRKKWTLLVFPKPFGWEYIIATCVAAGLFIASPGNFMKGLPAVLILVFNCIVKPVYEELVFRGIIWNSCEETMENELAVYLCNIALFALWQLGYATAYIAMGSWSIVFWKMIAGLGYGAVLGFVRMKEKNCYICMLVHSVLNLFMM